MRWVVETDPDQEWFVTEFIDNERKVVVSKLRDTNSASVVEQLEQGTRYSVARQLRNLTTESVGERIDLRSKEAGAAEDPGPVIVPNGLDAAGIFNSDPLYLSGEFWVRVLEGEKRQRSCLRIPGWVRGHALHCRRCQKHNEDGGLDLDVIEDGVLEGEYRRFYAKGCYGERVAAYLIYGFLPKFKKDNVPNYDVKTYRSLYKYKGLRAAWQKQLDMKGLFGPGDPRWVGSLTGAERPADVEKAAASGSIPKCRVCLDMSPSNEHMVEWPMRYEDAGKIATVVRRGDRFFKLDLSSFYLRLPAHWRLQQLQSCRDPFTKEIISYRFLAFGGKVNCTYSSGISAEARLIIMEVYRKLGITARLHSYIDDFMGRSQQTEDKTNEALEIATIVLEKKLGLPVAAAKSVRSTTTCELLGIEFNSVNCTMGVKPQHRQEALAKISKLLTQRRSTAKNLSRVCGLLNFLAPQILGARPYLRAFWDLLKHLKDNKTKDIPSHFIGDMQWWKSILEQGYPADSTAWLNPSTAQTVSVATDASGDYGGGAWANNRRFFIRWDEEQISQSVPWKEFFVMFKYITRFASQLRGHVVLAFTDSIANVYAINAGSSKAPGEAMLLRRLSDIQRRHRIKLLAIWLPREYNVIPDMLSKGLIPGEPL